VDEKGSLGIYLAPDKAVAVWTSSEGAVLHKFCIEPDTQEPSGIALQAARAAARQGFAFDEVFMAVDCSCFTQYNLNSEFDDYRQIDSTIKFDVEEAAATDAMNLAVTFEITGKETVGSSVTVYTADRQRLTDILLDTQEGGLDPTVIEPDAVALTRALAQTMPLSERTDSLFVILSPSNCYMIRPHADFAPMVRTFLISGKSNVEAALAREILMARAAGESRGPVTSVVLIGAGKSIDTAQLAQRTGLQVKTESPEKSLLRSTDDGSIACHEFLIAYGSALAARSRAGRVDFRRDFMPFQGQRKIMEGSLRVLSISLTVLLIAVGAFFQFKAFGLNDKAAELDEKALKEHKAVMYGKSPRVGQTPSSNLRREVNLASSSEKGAGFGDATSIPARLTFFLQAVNGTQPNVDIMIDQITVTGRSMKVKGSTNSRAGTMALLNQIRTHARITLGSERIAADGGRDGFDITIDPRK